MNTIKHLTSKNLSAKTVLTGSQKLFYGLAFVAWLASLWIFSLDAVKITIYFISAVYFAVVLFKVLIFIKGYHFKNNRFKTLKKFPTYSILIPIYRENEFTLKNLINSIKKINYDTKKLKVFLITNTDDHLTNSIVKSIKLPSYFRHFRVRKPYNPKGKPFCLNKALRHVDTDLMVVYDAEDVPDPDQLKKAATMFANLPENVVCLQGRLNYYNRNENLLTMLFTVEYTTWFDYFIPGLSKMNLPVPLGGTSNHFKVKYLKKLGCYDAYNVTEDCDIGTRIARAGWKVAALNSTTLEEACVNLLLWIRQRTRWVKGYTVTWLVHTRNFYQIFCELGGRGTVAFILFVFGVPLVNIINPILYAITLIWLLFRPDWIQYVFSGIGGLSFLLFAAGNVALILMGAIAVCKRKWYYLCPVAILMPFYCLLQSISTYRALYQTLFSPHTWEKTPHGLTKVNPIKQNKLKFSA